MNLNSILFPAPRCSYNYEKLKGKIIFIPKYKKANNSSISNIMNDLSNNNNNKDNLNKATNIPKQTTITHEIWAQKLNGIGNSTIKQDSYTVFNSFLCSNNNDSKNNQLNINNNNSNDKTNNKKDNHRRGLTYESRSIPNHVNENNENANDCKNCMIYPNSFNTINASNIKKHNAQTLSTIYSPKREFFQINSENKFENQMISRFNGNFKVTRTISTINPRSKLSVFTDKPNTIFTVKKLNESEIIAESTNNSQSNFDNQTYFNSGLKTLKIKNTEKNETIKLDAINTEYNEGIGKILSNTYNTNCINMAKRSQIGNSGILLKNKLSVDANFFASDPSHRNRNGENNNLVDHLKFIDTENVKQNLSFEIHEAFSYPSEEDSCVVDDLAQNPQSPEIVVSLKKDFKFIKQPMKQIFKSTTIASTKFNDIPDSGNIKPRESIKKEIQDNNQNQSKNLPRESGQLIKNTNIFTDFNRKLSNSSLDNGLIEEIPQPILGLISPQKLCTPNDVHKYNDNNSKILNQHNRNPFTIQFDMTIQGISSDYSTPRNLFHINGNNINGNQLQNQNSSSSNKIQLNNHSKHTIIEYYIPCLYLEAPKPTNKILIYFHGNGEDINLALDLLIHVKNNVNVNVVAMEYPGYGIYKGSPSDQRILQDTMALYDFFIHKLKVNPKDLIIFGRSIGSGPATYLAYRRIIGALILMSAFTSIRAVVKDLAGKWASYLIKERFNNLVNISYVTCPTFIVHGLRDSLISYKHSQALHNACKATCELLLPRTMDHIEFDFYDDFTTPLNSFLIKTGALPKPIEQTQQKKGFQVPAYLYELPKELSK